MLSVIIIAKNEELLLRRCLESVKWAQEIIVLDSGSCDKTVAIAKEFTPHVYETDWQGYGIQKERALSLASKHWILNLDADEWVDDALKREIEKAIKTNHKDAFKVPIKMAFYGKLLKYSQSPSRHVRLFKRNGAHYSKDIVHEKIVLPKNSKIGQLKNAIKHDSFHDLNHALYKINRYSSYSAKIRSENNKSKPLLIKSILATAWMFLRSYILQLGFLDGKAGFVFSCLNAQGTFYRHLKQIYPDKNIDEIPKV